MLPNLVFVGAQSAPPSFETELHSHNEAGALSLPLSFSLYYNVPCEIRTKREKLDSKFLYYFKESCRVHLYPFRSREEMKLLASYFVTQLYCLSAEQIQSDTCADTAVRAVPRITSVGLYQSYFYSYMQRGRPHSQGLEDQKISQYIIRKLLCIS